MKVVVEVEDEGKKKKIDEEAKQKRDFQKKIDD